MLLDTESGIEMQTFDENLVHYCGSVRVTSKTRDVHTSAAKLICVASIFVGASPCDSVALLSL